MNKFKLSMKLSMSNNFFNFHSIIWFTFMFIGFLLAFSITKKAWQRFQLNPTFTSLILKQDAMQIVYPTITVCPDNSGNEEKITKFTEKLGANANNTEELKAFFRAIPNFSYGIEELRSVVLSDASKKTVNRLSVDVRSLAFKLAKSCDDVFKQQTKFKYDMISSCDAFLPVYGEHGFCYAFNPKVYGTEKNE